MTTVIAPEELLGHLSEDESTRVQDFGETIWVGLLSPLTFLKNKLDGEVVLDGLTLPKKVKGKHLKSMDKVSGEISQSLALMASLAGVPAHALDELDARDLELLTTVMAPFLPKSRRTGLG